MVQIVYFGVYLVNGGVKRYLRGVYRTSLISICNIRFSYRIRKYFRNIPIYILCHERKKYEKYEVVKAIWCG